MVFMVGKIAALLAHELFVHHAIGNEALKMVGTALARSRLWQIRLWCSRLKTLHLVLLTLTGRVRGVECAEVDLFQLRSSCRSLILLEGNITICGH